MTYLNEIFRRFVDGKCTEEELSVLLRHFELTQYSEELDELVEAELAKEVDIQNLPPDLDEIVANNWTTLQNRNRLHQRKNTVVRSLKILLPIAGLVFLVSAIAIYFHLKTPPATTVAEIHDVLPGANRAFITLSDGQTIELSEQKDAVVISSGTIEYSDGNEIVQTSDIQHAVLTTPRAGQYQVRLPDGTLVLLNAESSLRYPLHFTGGTRHVELTGEAFFDVAQSVGENGERIPFIVESAGQRVEVLGTRFNVAGYPDDEAVQTALVEGAVRVHAHGLGQGHLLAPGELAYVRNGTVEVRQADLASITAWTNGDFVFNQEDLHSVMKKIARWYDVDIVYPDTQPDIRFSGAIARSRNLSAVLKMMEMTGEVTFEIEGRRVIIMR